MLAISGFITPSLELNLTKKPSGIDKPSASTTSAVTVVSLAGQVLVSGLADNETFPKPAVVRFLGEDTAFRVIRLKRSLYEPVSPPTATLPARYTPLFFILF